MSNSEQLEKDFMASGGEAAFGGKVFPQLYVKEKVGGYLMGTIIGNDLKFPTKYGLSHKINIRTKETDFQAGVRQKGDKVSTKIEVKPGMNVTIFSFTNLTNATRELPVGTEIYIKYLGVSDATRKAGQGNPHLVKVLYKLPEGGNAVADSIGA